MTVNTKWRGTGTDWYGRGGVLECSILQRNIGNGSPTLFIVTVNPTAQ